MPTRLDAAYAAAVQDVRRKVLAYSNRYWASLGDYRDDQVDLVVAKLVPRIESGQARIGQLTNAYIARTAATQQGGAITRGAATDTSTLALRGVEAAVVYQRPFVTVWSELSKGKQLADAVKAGADRLSKITDTDLQLARTHSARSTLQRAGVRMFQRVLTGSKSCALCVIASTQRYYSENLMPIHPGCGCSVAPYDGPDVQVINRDLLNNLHGAVTDRFGFADLGGRSVGLDTGRDYQHLIVAHEHGEIGPLLAVRGQKFTGSTGLPSY